MKICYSEEVHAQMLALRAVHTKNNSSISENVSIQPGNVNTGCTQLSPLTAGCCRPLLKTNSQHPGNHDRGKETPATPSVPRIGRHTGHTQVFSMYCSLMLY